MAKTESTAVNQLIAQVSGRPLESKRERDVGADLFGKGPKRPSARSIAPSASPPTLRGRPASGTENPLTTTARATLPPIPQPRPATGSASVRSSTLPPPHGRTSSPSLRVPDVKGTPAPERMIAPNTTAPIELINGTDWFVDSSQGFRSVDEGEIGTHAVKKTRRSGVGPLAGIAVLCAIGGVFVGGYFLFDGEGNRDGKAAAAPATAAAPAADTAAAAAPAAAAETAPVEPPVAIAPAAPALVDVVFTSKPVGASVVLVEGGRTIPIGSTPISASIDPSHSYEAVFALEGHETRIEKLDPQRDRRFDVDMRSGKTSIKHAEPVAAVAAVEPAKADNAKPEKKERDKRVAKAESRKAEKAEKKKADKAAKADTVVAAADFGDGVLMINAKPPCEIIIDGKATGLTTPQRSIALASGTHKVTLVNKDAGIKKTIAVKVTAGKATKVIQDYTADLK